MPVTNRYSFRKVGPADVDLLRRWQAEPHVREWWDDDDSGDARGMTDPRVARWIVALAGRPFAYMQDYTVHGWPDHHFYALPEGSRGIDQCIGAPDMVGKGHGPAFIRERVQALFDEGAPAVATDPNPANARAIAAYEKAGFRIFGPPQDTPWGEILPMKIDRPEKAG